MKIFLVKGLVLIFAVVSVQISPANAEQAGLAIGFRDLIIGSDATNFEKYCKRSMIPASYYECYGIKDLKFKWIEPGVSKWPQKGDELRSYVVTILNPELVVLNGSEYTNFMASEKNWLWAQQKRDSLFTSLNSKYDLVWYWDDPAFEGRRDIQIQKFMNDQNHTLDAVFENGQVVFSLKSKGSLPFPPSIRIQYRDPKMARAFLQSLGLTASEGSAALPTPTVETEF